MSQIPDSYATTSEAWLSDVKSTVEFSQKEHQWIEEHPVLRIGIDPGFAPFEFVDEKGEYQGISADFMSLISGVLGIKFEVAQDLTWQETVEKAQKHEIDILPCVGITEERRQYFTYSTPYLFFPRVVFYRKGGVRPSSMADLDDKLIGVQTNSSHHGWLDEHTGLQPILYSTVREAVLALSAGDVELFVGNLEATSYLLEKLEIDNVKVAFQIPAVDQELAMAVRNDWPEMVSILDKVLAVVPREKIFDIHRKWTNFRHKNKKQGGDDLLQLSDEEKKWLSEHRKITVRILSSLPPMDFTTSAGVPAGIGVDYLKIIEDKLGLEVEIKSGQYIDNLQAVQEKKADALMDATPDPNLEKYLLFTEPYLSIGHVIIARKEGSIYSQEQDLHGKTLALESGFAKVEHFRQYHPEINIAEYPDTQSCLRAVSFGDADAYAGNRAVASYIVLQQMFSNLKVQGSLQDVGTVLSIGVRNDWPELASILNKAFDSLDIAEKHSVLGRWVGLNGTNNAETVKLTPQEKQFIAEHGPLFFSEISRSPLFIINDQQKYDGIFADYMGLISERSGLKFKLFPSRIWPEVLEKYNKGEISVVPGLGKKCPVKRETLYSEPLVTFPLVIVTLDSHHSIAGTEELNGRKVCVVQQSTSNNFLRESYPEIQVREADSIEQALIMVANSEVDAFVGHLAVTVDMIQRLGFKNLKIAGQTEFIFDHRFGVDPQYPEVVSIIDKTLASISPEEHSAILHKWLKVTYDKGVDYSLILKVALGTVTIIAIVLFWNRRMAREIAERKNAQALLAEKENRIRAMSQAVPDALIMIDSKGEIKYMNHAAEKFFGGTKADFIDKHLHTLCVPAEERERAARGLAHFAKTGHGPAIGKIQELTCLAPDGSKFPVEVGISSFQVRGEWYAVGVIRNIAVRKETESKLRKLSKAVNQSPSSVAITDLDGFIEYVNPAFTKITGYTSAEAVGQQLEDFKFGKHSQVFYNRLRETVTTGGIWEGELVNKRKNGELYWQDTTISPIYDESGRITRYLETKQDVTDRKNAQQDLLKAKKSAEQATMAKSDFLAKMSHEIRTPMNAIIGMSYLVLQTGLNSTQRNYIEKVHRSSELLLGIIDDILDFSKIEAGRLDLEKIDFHLSDVLNNMANLVGLKAEEKGLALTVNLAPDIPDNFVGDPLRLGQILINLADNAVKFTEKGEITVSVAILSQNESEAELYFSVNDNGIGLTRAQQEKLFQSFSQADASTTRTYGGTGLGLAICHNLIHLMGGNIWVESEKDAGSSFQFTLILQKSQRGHSDQYAASAKIGFFRVLVVAEDSALWENLSLLLTGFGLRVEQAKSENEGLLRLQEGDSSGDPYMLVLMDWDMSGTTGFESVKTMQNSPGFTGYPKVIAMTPCDGKNGARGAKGVNISSFLAKPITSPVLYDAIMDAMGLCSVAKNEPVQSVQRSYDEDVACLRESKLLLVEDNEINLELACDLLSSIGIDVEVARNGVEALEKLSGTTFDGVLMDCRMPVMDGYEASRRIRVQERFKDLPILAMTANTMNGDREKVLEAGMNDHIGKPIDMKNLVHTLAKWVAPSTGSVQGCDDVHNTGILFPIVEGIDTEDGLARTRDNRKLYLKLLKMFAETQQDFMVEFQGATAASDWQHAEMIAHRLKGVAGNIGAGRLFCCCAVLEEQAGEKKVRHEDVKAAGEALRIVLQSIAALTAEE
ncbi:transporter substrate-binding domain-containing protein [Desulforhopalus singaporensis]|nr:transporter substrate-binding domain-containing protein [Desulforhopalus singaporensis]